jgi:hypothetical protein
MIRESEGLVAPASRRRLSASRYEKKNRRRDAGATKPMPRIQIWKESEFKHSPLEEMKASYP